MNDYGSAYEWKSFSEGMRTIESENKPGIVVIGKRFSGACRDFARSIADNKELISMSRHFVMILALDDDEPEDEKWLPGVFNNACVIIRFSRKVLSASPVRECG